MQLFGRFFGNKNQTATFSSSSTLENSINIKGAEYSAVDTKDGYYTLKDVLLFAEVPKGEKGAPEDVKCERMKGMVSKALSRYEQEKFVAPAHKGHHKALAFEDPEFLGFGLPKRVGRTLLDGKEQDAVYGDMKVKASAFERVRKGELPFLSPEVNWETWEFSSFAFLDSMPPHFKGPLITVGTITEDANAKFTVGATLSKGQFMALDAKKIDAKEEKADEDKHKRELDRVKKDEQEDTKTDGGSNADSKYSELHERISKMEASYAEMDKTMASVHYKMGLPYKNAQMGADIVTKKSDSSAPAEDKKSEEKDMGNYRFEDDPAAVAKFAAQEARTKALEDKLSAKDAEVEKKARVDGAFAELQGYPITDAGKAGIAKFADDPDKLKVFVEVLKAQTPKNPPKSVSAFESSDKEVKVEISGNDPDLATFQSKGPEAMEAALKYAARFEAMKQDKLCKGSKLVQDGRKAYIEFMMEMDPAGQGRVKLLA